MYLVQPLGTAHDKEGPLLIRQAEVVPQVHPHGAQLGDTVVTHRQPL